LRTYIEDHDFDSRLEAFLQEAIAALAGGNQKGWLKIINRVKEVCKEVDQLAHERGLNSLLLIDKLDEA
jgi:hypothetical protein